MTERYNEAAEQNLIGALLLSPDRYDRIAGMVNPGDFYFETHQILFSAIEQMMLANKPVEVFTLCERLHEYGELDRVGGLPYITHLHMTAPSAANIKAYAQTVADRSTERRLLSVTADIAEIVSSTLDVSDKVAAAQQAILDIGTKTQAHDPVDGRQLASEVLQEIQKRYENGGAIPGVSTGYKDIDAITGGLMPGNLVIIAGRPAMGKTTLALNIAENVSLHDGVAYFCSLEMSRLELGMRSMASNGMIDLKGIKNGRFDDISSWDKLTVATSRMASSGLVVDEYSNTIARLSANCRKVKRQKGKLTLVVVDYIGLMTAKADSKVYEIAEITRGLKLLAKELGCAVIALSQLSRRVDERSDKRPVLSDLRDSGSIEQDADIVMFAYRDEYYNPDSPNKGIAEILVAKNRMGETGMVPMSYFGRYSRFDSFSGEFVLASAQGKRSFND